MGKILKLVLPVLAITFLAFSSNAKLSEHSPKPKDTHSVQILPKKGISAIILSFPDTNGELARKCFVDVRGKQELVGHGFEAVNGDQPLNLGKKLNECSEDLEAYLGFVKKNENLFVNVDSEKRKTDVALGPAAAPVLYSLGAVCLVMGGVGMVTGAGKSYFYEDKMTLKEKLYDNYYFLGFAGIVIADILGGPASPPALVGIVCEGVVETASYFGFEYVMDFFSEEDMQSE